MLGNSRAAIAGAGKGRDKKADPEKGERRGVERRTNIDAGGKGQKGNWKIPKKARGTQSRSKGSNCHEATGSRLGRGEKGPRGTTF